MGIWFLLDSTILDHIEGEIVWGESKWIGFLYFFCFLLVYCKDKIVKAGLDGYKVLLFLSVISFFIFLSERLLVTYFSAS